MKNLPFAKLIDFFAVNLLIFLITFAWLKFFKTAVPIIIIIEFLILIIFNAVRYFFASNHSTKQELSKSFEQDLMQYMYTFLSNTTSENLRFFRNALSRLNNKNPNTNIEIIEEKNLIRVKDSKSATIFSPQFFHQTLTLEEALKVLSQAQKIGENKVVFFAFECDGKTKIFLESLKNVEVTIFVKKQIFSNILSPSGLYPKINFEFKPTKKFKIKELVEISFNRSRAKGYFWSGILIFFCSFIVKYNFYYVFMSSLLFFFTLLSLTKKDEKKST